ncbi:MAG TPA: VOC family protein [Terriglobales bacterium]|nr:VOC family protein [Terriglobales bacterium]
MEDIRLAGVYTRRTALMLAGAAMPLWSQTQPGGKDMGHPVVHFEIGCRDIAKTEQFFGELFGWHTQRNGPAAMIDTGSQQGIPGHITSLGHEPQHYTMFYVEVDDVQAYLDKAVSLGGKILVPPIKIPTGTFAWFSDPDGNTIGLLKRG